jgi:hypothetical protein
MSVTEKLMAPGQFNLTLNKETTPNNIINQIDAWGHIVIVPGDLNVQEFSDSTLLDSARYTGIVYSLEMGDESTVLVNGQGLVAYLGDGDTRGMPIAQTGGASGVRAYNNKTLEQTLDGTGTPKGILRQENGSQGPIRKGTITEPTDNSTYTGKHYTESVLKALQFICQDLGVEFKISTKGLLDAGPSATLFSGHSTDPTAIIVRGQTGEDPNITGLSTTSLVAQYDASEFVSSVELIGSKYGKEANIGNATVSSNPYNDLFGEDLLRTQYISEPQTQAGLKADRASAYLNELNLVKKQLNVSLDEYDIAGDFVVGDKIFIFDPDIGFVDTEADRITDGRSSLFETVYQGQVLNPTKIRILGITWPIKSGYGVFYRKSDGTYLELTDYCLWEEGDVQLEIGDVAPTISESLGFSGYSVDQVGGHDKSVPSAPSNLTTVAGTYSDGNGISKAFIKMTWQEPTNEDGSTITDGDQYRLRWRVVQDSDGNNIIDSNDTQATEYVYSAVSFSTREFIIYDLSPNLYYEVGVAALDLSGFDSSFTTITSVQTPADAGAPNKPDTFATIASNPLRVQFVHNLGQAKDSSGSAVSPVVDFTLAKDISHLNIYGSTTQGFNLEYNSSTKKVVQSGFKIGELLASSAHIQNGIAAVGYIDLDNADTHYFRVTAVDSSGNESEPSDEQSGNADLVNSQNIANLAVTNALIANAAITDLKVADVSAGKVTAGTISGQTIILDASGDTGNDSIIKSSNYVSGSTGWAITSDGTAEFQNATIRGSLNASDITAGTLSSDRLDTDFIAVGGAASDVNSGSTTIDGGNITTNSITTGQLNFTPLQDGDDITDGTVGGITINSDVLTTSNYPTTGFEIGADGDAVFNNITARGLISGTVDQNLSAGSSAYIQSSTGANRLRFGAGSGAAVDFIYNSGTVAFIEATNADRFTIRGYNSGDDITIQAGGVTGQGDTTLKQENLYIEGSSLSSPTLHIPNSTQLHIGGSANASSGDVLTYTTNGVQWQSVGGHSHGNISFPNSGTVLSDTNHSHATNTVLNTNTSFTGMVNHIAQTVGNSGTAHGLTLADVTTQGNTNVLTNDNHSHGTNNINAITSNYNNNVTAYNTAFSAAGAFNLYNTINSALNNKANNSALHNSHNYFTNADVDGSHHSHSGYLTGNESHFNSNTAHGTYVYYNDYLNHISNFNSHKNSNSSHSAAIAAAVNSHYNAYISGHLSSDRRFKTNIDDTSLGLEFIKRLQPREFDWTSDYLDDLLDPTDKHAIVARDIYTNIQQGFIVDEVKQAVFDQTGSNNAFSGLTYNPRNKDEQDTLDESNPVGYIRPTDFIPPLVKSVQELSAKIELLEARIDELEGV